MVVIDLANITTDYDRISLNVFCTTVCSSNLLKIANLSFLNALYDIALSGLKIGRYRLLDSAIPGMIPGNDEDS